MSAGLLIGEARVGPAAPFNGEIVVPGDKSVSHRAVLFGALAEGTTRIIGLSRGEDVGRTLAAVAALGARVCEGSHGLEVRGGRWRDAGRLDCGNSGTSARLLLGALAGRAGAVLDGDSSLIRRPMRRVLTPLRRMGARIEGESLPLRVAAAPLAGGAFRAEVASAQVKSAVLLAGLHAEGGTSYHEPIATRDHSERLLTAMGAPLRREAVPSAEGGGSRLYIRAGALTPADVVVPGDPSAAAFWVVAACIVPGSRLVVRGVGLNPTRAAVFGVLTRMGARIRIEPRVAEVEPIGDIYVEAGPLRGTRVAGAEVPFLIDEVPILAIAAAFAVGETVFADAAELRVKESDRIETTVRLLRALGVQAEAREDGLQVIGGGAVGGVVESAGDHRIAMAGLIAGLVVGSTIRGTGCISTSYPDFLKTLGEWARVETD